MRNGAVLKDLAQDSYAAPAPRRGGPHARVVAALPALVGVLALLLTTAFGVSTWRSTEEQLRVSLDTTVERMASLLDIQLGHLLKDLSLAAANGRGPDSARVVRALRDVSGWRSLRVGFMGDGAFDVDFEAALRDLPPDRAAGLLDAARDSGAAQLSRPFGPEDEEKLFALAPPPADAASPRYAAAVFSKLDLAALFDEIDAAPGALLSLSRFHAETDQRPPEIILRMRRPIEPDADKYILRGASTSELSAYATWRPLGAFDLVLAASISREAAFSTWLRSSGLELLFIAAAAVLATAAAIAIARTITRANAEQARATAELQAREWRLIQLGRENARLAAALQASPAAIMITDPKQQGNPIIYVNDAFERLTGYPRDEALGRDPGFLNSPSTEETAIAALRQAVCEGRAATIELINQRRDSSLWWNHVAMSPIFGDGGQVDAVVYVKSDLSDHKRYEAELTIAKVQAELANKAKSEFIAVTGHELRTPLNAIMGFSDLLRKEALGPLGHKDYAVYASDMYDSAAHLLALINDLLDLSKVESGRMEIEREPVDLNDAVDGALVMVRQRASETGVKIETAFDRDLPPVIGDARRLKQIALNLLTNAVKFTPARGVVSVATRTGADGVTLSVRDTGVGIPSDELEKVLEPYGQARNRIGGREAGTGLGLPLCKKLTELHGGVLTLDSVLGEGTVVTVALPPETAAEAA